MRTHIDEAHAADDREREKASDENKRHAVGDRHGQEVARGGECHQRRKQYQSDRVDDHGPIRARRSSCIFGATLALRRRAILERRSLPFG